MRFLMLSVLALAGCQTVSTPAPQPPEAPRYHLVDLSGDFVRFYDATEGQSDAERLAAFYRDVAPRFPEFYERFAGRGDQVVLRAIQQFPDIRQRYLSASAQFSAAMDPAFTSFSHAFPDMQPIGDVYLVHSLGEMDGGTRQFHGQTYFIFGADVMARVHAGFSSESPFFHHELFHRYHGRFFGDCEPVWCGLWQEGLAVYVAAQLNPNASDDELLLTFPQPIRPAVEGNRTLAFCTVKTRLDSTSEDDSRMLFQGQGTPPGGLPARFAYYVGYLVAQEAARTHTLQELAHMSAAEVHPMIEAELTALAPNCPAN